MIRLHPRLLRLASAKPCSYGSQAKMEEVVPSPTDRKERGYTHGTEQNRSCGVYSGGNCRNGSHTNASCSHGSGSESGLSQECPYHHPSRGSCDLEARL